ncbi:hypothetical protein FEM01_22860 [Pseudomonas mosselii]|uniref:Uncharacterized protein n=1 Tax=Pseudomonas mosselii TaxID=78327 RepID=A0A5R8YLS0_9PSED|nr:hypothetical protein FEM01_22860 [Pseudomonas mosselii]
MQGFRSGLGGAPYRPEKLRSSPKSLGRCTSPGAASQPFRDTRPLPQGTRRACEISSLHDSAARQGWVNSYRSSAGFRLCTVLS